MAETLNRSPSNFLLPEASPLDNMLSFSGNKVNSVHTPPAGERERKTSKEEKMGKLSKMIFQKDGKIIKFSF